MSHTLTIATRESPLALWQATFVQKQLQRHHPHLTIHIKGMKTIGDNWLETPLYEIGGKSLFVKELEQALLEKKADIAVHSLKDMPVDLPEGLMLGAICERESPFDAIILAEAGLSRLGLQQHIVSVFTEDEMIPAVGQGGLGIECRADDDNTRILLAPLHHAPTATCVLAERAMNRALGGNCHVPVAGFAKWVETKLQLRGRVGEVSNYAIIEATAQSEGDNPERLGKEVAQTLMAKGAKAFI